MTWFSELYKNAVVKKAIMAVTGLVLFGWLLGHLLGNLKVFQGAEKFNAYAEYLRTMGTPLLPEAGVLWLVRGLLSGSIGFAHLVRHVAHAHEPSGALDRL